MTAIILIVLRRSQFEGLFLFMIRTSIGARRVLRLATVSLTMTLTITLTVHVGQVDRPHLTVAVMR